MPLAAASPLMPPPTIRYRYEATLSTLQLRPFSADIPVVRLSERLFPVLFLGAVAAGVPALVEWVVGHHAVTIDAHVHFYAVGFTALAAAAACVALSVVGARLNKPTTGV